MHTDCLLPRLLLAVGLPLALLVLACSAPASASTAAPSAALPARLALSTLTVYSDALGAGWQDWSWNEGGGSPSISVDLANSAVHHNASGKSIAVHYTGGWSGMQLGNSGGVDGTAYDTLSFWVNGGSSGGQHITVQLSDTDNVLITPVANTWTLVQLPLSQFGSPSIIGTLRWYNGTANAQPTFYLDDIALLNTGLPTPTTPPPSGGPALTVNVAAGLHAISPYIYGLNFADPALAADIALPVNRWGGNATTRYNWQLDISNHASDWYFENIDNDNANPTQLPNGSASDQFVTQNKATNTDTLLTVPLIGYTPKGPRGANPRNCGFSTLIFHNQQSADGSCGNGKMQNGALIVGNNPLDTSLVISPTFVAGWITHLVSNFGAAGSGGVRFYDLDNETGLWNSTHRDVHPLPVSYDELISRTVAYAPAIKHADPAARLLGPVAWGWLEYYYSALDLVDGNGTLNTPLDRLAHNNTPFVEYYLQQMAAYEHAHGLRILDYLDLHMYPLGGTGNVALSGAGSAATQALRLRSTRSLWDPSYTDESWINAPVDLIPNMRTWVANDYPGTKLAISEYNWGALDHINGAVTEADILGIFGREGLDLATLWGPPSSDQPGAFAFRMYRNYDGQHHTFGETGVQSASADQSQLAVYSALRAGDGALTIMVVNKSLTQTLSSTLALSGFSPAPQAATYRYSAADLHHIVHQPDQVVTSTGFTANYPPQSITLFVLQPGVPLTPRAYLPMACKH